MCASDDYCSHELPPPPVRYPWYSRWWWATHDAIEDWCESDHHPFLALFCSLSILAFLAMCAIGMLYLAGLGMAVIWNNSASAVFHAPALGPWQAIATYFMAMVAVAFIRACQR